MWAELAETVELLRAADPSMIFEDEYRYEWNKKRDTLFSATPATKKQVPMPNPETMTSEMRVKAAVPSASQWIHPKTGEYVGPIHEGIWGNVLLGENWDDAAHHPTVLAFWAKQEAASVHVAIRGFCVECNHRLHSGDCTYEGCGCTRFPELHSGVEADEWKAENLRRKLPAVPPEAHLYVLKQGDPAKAVIWTGDNWSEVHAVYPGLNKEYIHDKGGYVGCWVVSPSKGHVHFISPESFAAIYESSPTPPLGEPNKCPDCETIFAHHPTSSCPGVLLEATDKEEMRREFEEWWKSDNSSKWGIDPKQRRIFKLMFWDAWQAAKGKVA